MDNKGSDKTVYMFGCRSRGCKLETKLGIIFFVEIVHEIFSTVLILILEEQLSVTG